ncbi:MAG: hypothetical protein ABIO65_12705, partial [Nitrospiria bacterium]
MTGSVLGWVAFVFALLAVAPLPAAAQEARFLAKEDILLFGLGLKVEPAQQTVPKDIATIVSTYLQAPTVPDGLPPFAPDAEVRATLRGPSVPGGLELVVKPNTPFQIPPLTVPGIHTLENIRLISNGQVLFYGTPESVEINVIEKLLVTQVTARPLTAEEIRERGIVYDKSNFQAYNFTAAFAVAEGEHIQINFPVVLPTLQGAEDVSVSTTEIPQIDLPQLTSLATIIPDTLKIQTKIPNLSVVGFTLKLDVPKGQDFFVPPIPGVIVIPGDIGFLNQYFSVMLMVSNVAPQGSRLVVTDLKAQIVLPPGRDTVVGSADDPLRMAQTVAGEAPRMQPIVQPGADGKLGTSDDIVTLGPGETGNADYLVEGRREGSHVVEMEISGMLTGLPVGPVPIRGRAAGAVLVRNPTFTLTFTHPEIVNAGEAYTLDVTVTNTSESPANIVSLNLYPRNVSGATVVGEPTREIETIPPGDSATMTFDLVSKVTGKVTAATLDSDEQVAGRFALKTAVGELGVPLSPDSLVLPREAGSLPKRLRDAAIGLLGKAYAVATAPAAALPRDVTRFSKKIVWDRAVEVAEAGFRYTLHEPLRDSAAQLAMDFMGSNFARLSDFNPKPDDLEFARNDAIAFDELRRRSVRGDVFADAVASLLAGDLRTLGVAPFHLDLAEKISYRPDHLSVLVGTSGGPLPVGVSVIDAQGRKVGGTDAKGKAIKEIPFSDLLTFTDQGQATSQLAILAAPEPGAFIVRLEKLPGASDDASFTVSLVLPDGSGRLRQVVYRDVSILQVPTVEAAPGALYSVAFEVVADGSARSGPAVAPTSDRPISDPPPRVISVVQQPEADKIENECGVWRFGRVVAVLFSEEVTPESIQDKFKPENITHYEAEANRVVGVALQPGRRIAFLALRDPVGPFIPRTLSLSEARDRRNQVMTSVTLPIEATIEDPAGVVSGRVLNADGTPVESAEVRLFTGVLVPSKFGGCEIVWRGVSTKQTTADGTYAWDYVLQYNGSRIVAIELGTEEFRDVRFKVQRNGQRLNVNIVILGRGTFQGRTLAEDGRTPLKDTAIRVTSLTDQSEYGATTDEQGRFIIARIPVGNLFVEAVNVAANAEIRLS